MGMMIHRNRKRKKERGATSDGINQEENLPFSDSDIEFEERRDEQRYTKTEIQRMSTADLQNLAATEGIENAFGKSGNELKKVLAEHFGL